MVRGRRQTDRRHFVAGAGAAIVAGPVHACIAVDRFGRGPGRSIILLHGSDGLTNSGRYEFAAQMIAAAGYSVWLPRYFEATGDRRARYGEIKTKFPIWLDAIEGIRIERQDRPPIGPAAMAQAEQAGCGMPAGAEMS